MPSDMHDYRTSGVGRHRSARRVPARSGGDVSESRLLRRVPARGVRALPGVAARARAPTGAVPRAAARRAARRGARRARRLRRRRPGRPRLRPERDAGRQHRRLAARARSPATRCCRRTSSTARSTCTWEHVCGDFGARYVRTPDPTPVAGEERSSDASGPASGRARRVLFLSHHTSVDGVDPARRGALPARARAWDPDRRRRRARPGPLPARPAQLDVDFYAGNCHKWLCAPKGAGFLYVRRELQGDVHPLVISWGYKGDDADASSRATRSRARAIRPRTSPCPPRSSGSESATGTWCARGATSWRGGRRTSSGSKAWRQALEGLLPPDGGAPAS